MKIRGNILSVDYLTTSSKQKVFSVKWSPSGTIGSMSQKTFIAETNPSNELADHRGDRFTEDGEVIHALYDTKRTWYKTAIPHNSPDGSTTPVDAFAHIYMPYFGYAEDKAANFINMVAFGKSTFALTDKTPAARYEISANIRNYLADTTNKMTSLSSDVDSVAIATPIYTAVSDLTAGEPLTVKYPAIGLPYNYVAEMPTPARYSEYGTVVGSTLRMKSNFDAKDDMDLFHTDGLNTDYLVTRDYTGIGACGGDLYALYRDNTIANFINGNTLTKYTRDEHPAIYSDLLDDFTIVKSYTSTDVNGNTCTSPSGYPVVGWRDNGAGWIKCPCVATDDSGRVFVAAIKISRKIGESNCIVISEIVDGTYREILTVSTHRIETITGFDSSAETFVIVGRLSSMLGGVTVCMTVNRTTGTEIVTTIPRKTSSDKLTCCILDSMTIIVESNSGKIYRSIDAGSSFTPVEDSTDISAVGSICKGNCDAPVDLHGIAVDKPWYVDISHPNTAGYCCLNVGTIFGRNIVSPIMMRGISATACCTTDMNIIVAADNKVLIIPPDRFSGSGTTPLSSIDIDTTFTSMSYNGEFILATDTSAIYYSEDGTSWNKTVFSAANIDCIAGKNECVVLKPVPSSNYYYNYVFSYTLDGIYKTDTYTVGDDDISITYLDYNGKKIALDDMFDNISAVRDATSSDPYWVIDPEEESFYIPKGEMMYDGSSTSSLPNQGYSHVEVIAGINRRTTRQPKRSNLYSIRINNNELNGIKNSTIRSNILQQIKNAIRSMTKRLCPANTQLFDVYFN